MQSPRLITHALVAAALMIGLAGTAVGDKHPQQTPRVASAAANQPSAPTAGKPMVSMPSAKRRWANNGRPKVRLIDGWYPTRRADVTRNNVVDQFIAKDKALRQGIAAQAGADLVWDTIMIGAGIAAEDGAMAGWDAYDKSVLLITNEAELRRGNVSNTASRKANGRVLYPKALLSLDAMDPDVLLETAQPNVVETRVASGGNKDGKLFRVTLANGTSVLAKRVSYTDHRGYRSQGLPERISHLPRRQVPFRWITWPAIYSGDGK